MTLKEVGQDNIQGKPKCHATFLPLVEQQFPVFSQETHVHVLREKNEKFQGRVVLIRPKSVLYHLNDP